MATVGIIANPVSGKDIRRLVAHGSVFDNQEKVRIVRRVLMGLAAAGIRKVAYMPDDYAIVPRAMGGCSAAIEAAPVPLKMENSQTDSTRCAAWMQANGIDCIIVLGGDGTCRAVAKGTVQVPLMPVSTGTNNVFPYMIEATVAGLAAGLVASGAVPRAAGVYRSCRLEVMESETLIDIALVDVAVVNDLFIAARAIWDIDKVSQIFLTQSRPEAIGLSSIGGQLVTIDAREPRGLYLAIGPGGSRVTAPIAPGLLKAVPVAQYRVIAVGNRVGISSDSCVLALDGEREVEVRKGRQMAVRLSDQGPLVVDLEKTMACVQSQGLLVAGNKGKKRAGQP